MALDKVEHEDRQRAHYDKEYSRYREYKLVNWQRSYLKLLFRNLTVNQKDIFLDIGVGGAGYVVIEAARRGLYALGLDISKSGIQKAHSFARAELTGESGSCEFLVADAAHLPFRDSSTDKIACVAVLEHVPDDDEVIKEMGRVLRVGGRCFIVVPNSYRRSLFIATLPYLIHDKRVGHLRHYTIEDLTTKFEKNHLRLLQQFYKISVPKIAQFLLYNILSVKIDLLWWGLEKLDERMSKIPVGLSLCAIFQKLTR